MEDQSRAWFGTRPGECLIDEAGQRILTDPSPSFTSESKCSTLRHTGLYYAVIDHLDSDQEQEECSKREKYYVESPWPSIQTVLEENHRHLCMLVL